MVFFGSFFLLLEWQMVSSSVFNKPFKKLRHFPLHRRDLPLWKLKTCCRWIFPPISHPRLSSARRLCLFGQTCWLFLPSPWCLLLTGWARCDTTAQVGCCRSTGLPCGPHPFTWIVVHWDCLPSYSVSVEKHPGSFPHFVQISIIQYVVWRL